MAILRFLKNENFAKIYWSCNFEGFFSQMPLRSHECFFYILMLHQEYCWISEKNSCDYNGNAAVSPQKCQKIKIWSTLRSCGVAMTSFQGLKLFVF